MPQAQAGTGQGRTGSPMGRCAAGTRLWMAFGARHPTAVRDTWCDDTKGGHGCSNFEATAGTQFSPLALALPSSSSWNLRFRVHQQQGLHNHPRARGCESQSQVYIPRHVPSLHRGVNVQGKPPRLLQATHQGLHVDALCSAQQGGWEQDHPHAAASAATWTGALGGPPIIVRLELALGLT